MMDIMENNRKKKPYYGDESISMVAKYNGKSKKAKDDKQDSVISATEAEIDSTDVDFGVHFMLQNDRSAFERPNCPTDEILQRDCSKSSSAKCSDQSAFEVKTLSKDEQEKEGCLSNDEATGSDLAVVVDYDALAEHRTNCKEFFCVICDKTLRSSKSMQRHELTHRAIKRHQCEVCGRKFHQLYNLRTHQVVHTGEKPYRCEVCGKSFSWKISLKGHYERYHKNTPFEGNFKKGIEKASGSPRTRVLRRNEHKCGVCNKTFKRFKELEFHLQIHTSTMRCPICNKCILDTELTAHLLTHFADRKTIYATAADAECEDELECNLCTRSFTNIDQWNFHLRSHMENFKKTMPYYRRR